jgi:hypothetical protein
VVFRPAHLCPGGFLFIDVSFVVRVCRSWIFFIVFYAQRNNRPRGHFRENPDGRREQDIV